VTAAHAQIAAPDAVTATERTKTVVDSDFRLDVHVARAAIRHYLRQHAADGPVTVYELSRRVCMPRDVVWEAAATMPPTMANLSVGDARGLAGILSPVPGSAFPDDQGIWCRLRHAVIAKGHSREDKQAMRLIRRLVTRGPLRVVACRSTTDGLVRLLDIGSVVCWIEKPLGRRIPWVRLADGAGIPTVTDANRQLMVARARIGADVRLVDDLVVSAAYNPTPEALASIKRHDESAIRLKAEIMAVEPVAQPEPMPEDQEAVEASKAFAAIAAMKAKFDAEKARARAEQLERLDRKFGRMP